VAGAPGDRVVGARRRAGQSKEGREEGRAKLLGHFICSAPVGHSSGPVRTNMTAEQQIKNGNHQPLPSSLRFYFTHPSFLFLLPSPPLYYHQAEDWRRQRSNSSTRLAQISVQVPPFRRFQGTIATPNRISPTSCFLLRSPPKTP
jgi:hypothetical protein